MNVPDIEKSVLSSSEHKKFLVCAINFPYGIRGEAGAVKLRQYRTKQALIACFVQCAMSVPCKFIA